MSVVISSQTGDSGAPETTDDQPCSGGPSRELNNIIGELGHLRLRPPLGGDDDTTGYG